MPVLTPKMWNIKQRIDFLTWVCATDPGDYMSLFELQELKAEFDRLSRIEAMGLRVIPGGKHPSNSSTDSAA